MSADRRHVGEGALRKKGTAVKHNGLIQGWWPVVGPHWQVEFRWSTLRSSSCNTLCMRCFDGAGSWYSVVRQCSVLHCTQVLHLARSTLVQPLRSLAAIKLRGYNYYCCTIFRHFNNEPYSQ